MKKQSEPTPMELAFWKYAELYTGMQSIDMEKSSHGRAFIAGWQAALKNAASLLNQIHDAHELTSKPGGFKREAQES